MVMGSDDTVRMRKQDEDKDVAGDDEDEEDEEEDYSVDYGSDVQNNAAKIDQKPKFSMQMRATTSVILSQWRAARCMNRLQKLNTQNEDSPHVPEKTNLL